MRPGDSDAKCRESSVAEPANPSSSSLTLTCARVGRFAGWLVGRSVGWSDGCSNGRLVGLMVSWSLGCLVCLLDAWIAAL